MLIHCWNLDLGRRIYSWTYESLAQKFHFKASSFFVHGGPLNLKFDTVPAVWSSKNLILYDISVYLTFIYWIKVKIEGEKARTAPNFTTFSSYSSVLLVTIKWLLGVGYLGQILTISAFLLSWRKELPWWRRWNIEREEGLVI